MTDSKNAPNPFDLASLKTPPDYIKTGEVKTVNLKVRSSQKAPKEKFIRVHPFDIGAGTWCLDTLMYVYSDDGDMDKEGFIVPAGTEAFEVFSDRVQRFVVVAAITKKHDFFLWELKIPDPNGNSRAFDWQESKLKCAKLAVDEWVSVEADVPTGAYKARPPAEILPEPTWPELEFPKMLELCYRDRIITSKDHPVVKEILGMN